MYDMMITIPDGWIKVSEEGLEEFLKTCADYRSECYVGSRRLSFAHNKESFAVIVNRDKEGNEGVYVRPDLLVK